MTDLKVGMYVRCPVDRNEREYREFLLGQITKIDELMDRVKVKFHDLYNMSQYFGSIIECNEFDIREISRCKILNDSKIIYNNNVEANILSNYSGKTEVDGDYYKYYIEFDEEIKLVEEKDIKVHFNRDDVSVINQLLKYEFNNPIWYQCRSFVSDYTHAVKNSPNGIETMLGSRVFLLPHQIDTIMNVVNERKCRFMLADEVGLGKTIEASIILKYLKGKNSKLKCLIIVPDSLIYQWKTELRYKFWLDVSIGYSSNSDDIVLYPLEKINTPESKVIFEQNWDLLIVDETHRIISMDYEYNKILSLSRRTKNVLLITATPIQQRKTEYLKFLKILKPSYYENMSENDFEKLLEKQSNIRSKIYSMTRDLKDYEELVDYYEEDLKDIAEEINDKVFNNIVESIDINVEDKGLKGVKLALAYLGEYYQIERQIIRHRRIELQEQLAKRELEEVTYTQIGSELNFYERDVSEEIHSYLDKIIESNQSSKVVNEYIKEMLSALYSSPWALEFMIKNRLFAVSIGIKWNEDQSKDLSLLSTPRKDDERRTNLTMYINSFEGEKEELDYILDLTKRWKNATIREFDNMEQLYNDPDLIKGKFLKFLDFILENYGEEKVVIFTSWNQTAVKLEELIKRKLGDESCVSFHSKKNDKQLEESVDKFQRDKSCRFMVCDELGGEGRNFQMADAIIHFDMPWSPIVLEQRIGRLDRIGRDPNRSVTSVVIYSENTVEESLFRIWKESLNVFNESLSGLELVFEEIQNRMLSAIREDVRYGLNNIFEDISSYAEQMKEYVEEEQYIDMARHLDRDKEDKINDVLGKFSEENGDKLKIVMNKWGNLIGFKSTNIKENVYEFSPKDFQPNAFKRTFFTLPNMRKTRKITNMEYGIKGTFSRAKAIEREDLIFFAPGDEFFDSIIDNAIEVNKGRCCAFYKDSQVEWKGIILKWSIDINTQRILEGNRDALKYIKTDYMPMDHIYTIHPFDGYEDVDKTVVLDEYLESLEINPKSLTHLGMRNGKNIKLVKDSAKNNLEWFKLNYPRALWRNIVKNACKEGKKEAVEIVRGMDIRGSAKKDFENQLNSIRSVDLYYKYNNKVNIEKIKDKIEYYNLILSSLTNPKLTIDSAAVMYLSGDENE